MTQEQTEALLAEAVQWLNDKEYDAAMKCFRQIHDIRNVFVCKRCHRNSSRYDANTGCIVCGNRDADVKIVRYNAEGVAV